MKIHKIIKNRKRSSINGGQILQNLFNPFVVLGLSFLLAFVLFFLNWSDTYPKLDISLLVFLSTIIVISLLVGFLYTPIKIHFPDKVDWNRLLKVLYLFSILSFISFGITFWLKGMPFYIILFTDQVFDHLNYAGVNILTISGVTLNAVCVMFYSIILIQTEKKILLIGLLLLSLVPLILLFNRSVFFVTLLPVFFFLLRALSKKWIFSLVIFLFIGLYVFGLMGDKRENSKGGEEEDVFYKEFMGDNYPGFLPKQFFWTYFYVSSPIAKLQYTVNDSLIVNQQSAFAKGLVFEILPSSIGLRIADYLNWERRTSDYGYPGYFVGTCFGRIFFYWKWPGLTLYGVIFLGFIAFSIKLLRKRNDWIRTPVICILNSMMILSVFTNMLTFTAFYIMAFWVVSMVFILKKLEIVKPQTSILY